MGKVFYDDPIHHISGKISKKYRTCYNYKRVNGLKFTCVHGDRTRPVSVEELARREKFRIVRLAARERAMTPNTLNADQLAWRTARNAGDPHTTFNGWLFSKGWRFYDAGTKTVVWPEGGL